jgi:hypothetical protein
MDFPSNSHSNKTRERPIDGAPQEKPEEKKLEAVVTGEVVRRKKPLGRRFKETFLGGDAKGVLGFVMLDVMIPAAKDMMADAVSQGIERMLFGEARSTSRRPRGGGNGYVSYNRYSSNTPRDGRREEPRSVSRSARARHDFDEIILATRVEAEEVIDRLSDLVQRYESATVADLYDLVGVSGNYTDDKWGWTDIRGAAVQRIRNGYLLDLPKPDYLDR